MQRVGGQSQDSYGLLWKSNAVIEYIWNLLVVKLDKNDIVVYLTDLKV